MSRELISLIAMLLVGVYAGFGAETHSSNHIAEAELKKLTVAPGLKAELFAAEPLLENPVAFSLDGRGRVFVAESHRWDTSVFDITKNTPWLLDDLSFRTVNDRAAFLARTFATNFAVLTNQSERIRLVEDRDGDGRAETSSVFADDFREPTSGTAAGVLAQGTNVWFTSIPDLWRFTIYDLRFTNAATRAAAPSNASLVNRKSDFVNRLATGLGVHIGVSGHDVHGLIRGHDGCIYFSFGDRGVCVTNREGVVLNVPDAGGVLRCEPDGRNLEIFCTGLRNPQELAFDDLGNLWTVDNDTAGADPCRVLHLVEGGDYGWRTSYQHMKGFGPWVSEELWRGGLDGILPPAGTVSQGPAGLAFYPGTGATPQLAGKFVHADFPGGIWAFGVKPRGASYEIADKEKVLWNCWPTDVDFGPDGALYVLDWVQGWGAPGKGRVYRLAANAELGARNAEQVAEVKRFLGEGMSRRSEKELLSLLGHADRRVRLEAQWELAGRGTNSFRGLIETARTSKNLLQRIHALWGTRQVVRNLPASEGAEEFASLLPLLQDSSPEIRGQAAVTLGEARLFNAEEPLAKLLMDRSPRTRSLTVLAYTKCHAPQFAPGTTGRAGRTHFSRAQSISGSILHQMERTFGVDLRGAYSTLGATVSGKFPASELNELLPNSRHDPFLTHAAVDFLTRTRRNSAFETHFLHKQSVESALALLWANRRTERREVGNFLTDKSPHSVLDAPRIVLETARAINDTPIPSAYFALADLLEDPRFVDTNWGWSTLSNITPAGPFSPNVRPPREQVLRRALNANFRLGESKHAEALARFAAGTPNSNSARASAETGAPMPASLRAEALFLLGAWEVLPAPVGDLPIKPARDPNHGAVPTVNPENWPGWFDRVVGVWRPLPPRPPIDARRALMPYLDALLADRELEVARAALAAAVKLRLADCAPTLLTLMKAPATPVALRQEIPAALAVFGAPELSEAVKLCLADADATVRAAALPYLDRLPAADAVKILGGIVTGNSEPRLAQAAFAALGPLEAPGVDDILRAALGKLADGKLLAALELDLVEAASRRADPEIKSLLARRESGFASGNPLAPWRDVLAGGEVSRGRTIFFEKTEVQCSRCHAVKGEGGTVGPKLDGIGARQSREQLLESILWPNKTIAAGFENVVVTLRDGTTHAGHVKRESATELELIAAEGDVVKIDPRQVQRRDRGLSAMPEELVKALTRRELRDLIEWLASLSAK